MADHKRPLSMQVFEWLNVASLIYEMVTTESEGIFGDLLFAVAWLGLVFWITRGRSKAARIVYTTVTALTVAALIAAYRFGFVEPPQITLVTVWAGIQMGGLLTLLWWPSTTSWLNTKPQQAPAAPASN